MTPEQHRELIDFVGYDETITVTDALGTPTASIVLYSGFGDKIGDFEVDVVKVDPKCPIEPAAP